MVTQYEILVFVHIVAVVVVVGGGVMIQMLALRALASRDPVRVVEVARSAEWASTRLFAPAAIILLGAGVWAVEEGGWDYGDAWIAIGFAVWAVSFLVESAFLGPESRRVAAAVETGGPASGEALFLITRILWVARVELSLLVLAIFAMVAKLGL